MIAIWFKTHIAEILMGIAGATVTALITPQKRLLDRVIGWIVGVILCTALSNPTAQFLANGHYVELFGFAYGMGGITLAKMILLAINKKSKTEIESKLGVKVDDDLD